MKLTVKLSTTLRDYVPDYVPETGLQVEMPEGSTVAQLAQHLGLPPQDIKIVMVNGPSLLRQPENRQYGHRRAWDRPPDAGVR